MRREYNLSTLINETETKYAIILFKGQFWTIKVVIFTCFVSFSWSMLLNRGYVYENFRGFYADVILNNPQPFYFWNSIVEQGKEPLEVRNFPSGSHEANRTFRFTVPIISKVMHLNGLGLYILQNVIGLVTLYLITGVFYEIFQDKTLTFYAIFAFVNVYVGSGFFFNCFGHADAYTFFFITTALLIRNPLLLSIIVQLAFWCDERSVVTVFGIGIFHYLYFGLSRKKALNVFLLLGLNVLLYIILRLYLSSKYHLVSEDVETLELDRYWYFIKYISLWYGKRTYMGVEGFSLILLLVFWIFIFERDYRSLGISIFYWLPILTISFLVGDTVRTLSFTFVFWISAFIFLKERINRNQLKALLLIVAFINFLIPTSFP